MQQSDAMPPGCKNDNDPALERQVNEDGKAVTFRDATHQDVAAIVRLLADDALGRTREMSGHYLDSVYTEAFEAIQQDPNNRLIVAVLGVVIVGCMQLTIIPHLTFKGGKRLQIEGVRVDKTVRNRKVGAAMMSWARAVAEADGCHLIQLTSNRGRDDALRFYESQGFEPSHVGFKMYLQPP